MFHLLKKRSLKYVVEAQKNNVVDKWEGYFSVYDNETEHLRSKPINLLEIGVQNGGSLEVWCKYFSKSKNVIGVDIDPNCSGISFNDKRIKVIVGDSNSTSLKEELRNVCLYFDVIIDEGSHKSYDVIKTFTEVIQLMNSNGVYIIEDLCCSYWQNFQGGVEKQDSSINFFKKLVDVINIEHWRNGKDFDWLFKDVGVVNIKRETIEALNRIKSISFYNSMCIVKISDNKYQTIGKRVVKGNVATLGKNELDGQEISDVDEQQDLNPYS